MFKCHYCGFSGCAKEPDEQEKRKWMEQQPWFNEAPIRKQKPVYKKPTHTGNTSLSQKALAWFSGRGISPATLTALKVTEGQEWMPQKNGKANTIQFNYYHNGELKTRSSEPGTNVSSLYRAQNFSRITSTA
jgi:twinkle protein